MNFDEALIQIGEFGTYQKRVYFLLCLPGINAGIFMVMSVFILGVPDHRCALPGWDNDTYQIQSQHHLEYINKTIPSSSEKDLTYDQCNVYQSNVSYDMYNQPINASTESCDRWVYDDSLFKSTFTSEHDLICEDKFMPSLAKMLFFAGVLVGAFGFGVMSDAIGRKKTLMFAFVLVIASSVALTWANSFALFVALRFLIGAANAGIFMTGFVIGMELVGPSKRMWAGIVIEYFFAIGLVILAGVAYLIRDWKYIELAVSLPNVLYLVYFWIIPESPRWLMSQGRYDEAEAILKHAAKVNNATLPEKIFDRKVSEDTTPKGKIWNLFTSKVMAMRTLVIFFNWAVVSMVYYGLSLNTGNLGGSFYLNFLISGLVEFPAYTLCIIFLDRLGRKWLHCIAMVGGGLACISTVFTTVFGGDDLHTLTVALAMIGKVGASAGFAIIYVFSAELYPTILRNAGMGASSCCARIGGILAPYIAGLTDVISGNLGKALPLVIFGAASVAAGLLALLLPETLNRQLPETIQDAEQFAKSPKTTPDKEVVIGDDYTNGNHVNKGYVMDCNTDTGDAITPDETKSERM